MQLIEDGLIDFFVNVLFSVDLLKSSYIKLYVIIVLLFVLWLEEIKVLSFKFWRIKNIGIHNTPYFLK